MPTGQPANASQTAPVLVTGTAGFIGFHVALRLLREGRTVVGRQMLEKLAILDQHDRLGASALLTVVGCASAVAAAAKP